MKENIRSFLRCEELDDFIDVGLYIVDSLDVDEEANRLFVKEHRLELIVW
jgi:hypothetical protein